MHDGMPYGRIQGQGQGHSREVDRQSPTGLIFILFFYRQDAAKKRQLLDLLTGQNSGFSPRRGDSLHRFTSNLAGPTGTVCLAVQNFTSIATGRWECGSKNVKKFHFLVKSRPAGATSLTDFENF